MRQPGNASRPQEPLIGHVGRSTEDKTIVCITQLMDHAVVETQKLYADTEHAETFLIYHDGLSLWWSKEAQDYLEFRWGMRDRQVRCMGDTDKGNRYAGKVVGDSPELCAGLDAFGFADHKRAVRLNAMPDTQRAPDQRQFGLGTPNQLWNSLVLAWEHAPSSERIIEDIERLPRVLEKIIDAKGCVVPDENFRHGRRYLSLRGEDCKKPIRRQRKSTNVGANFHPSLQECWVQLMGLAVSPDDEVT